MCSRKMGVDRPGDRPLGAREGAGADLPLTSLEEASPIRCDTAGFCCSPQSGRCVLAALGNAGFSQEHRLCLSAPLCLALSNVKQGDTCRASVFVPLFAGSSQLEYSMGTEVGFRAMIPNLGALRTSCFFLK